MGIRHIAFVVHDLTMIVDGLRGQKSGHGREVQDFEDTFRLCYVRGPEGLIVELAERIDSEVTD